MLQLLHIENIAVIEEADITFDRGFNALTGETGAGKSIVIDAMGAVLGQRTSRDLIRTGAAKAFVSAVFTDVPPLRELAECGLEAEDGSLVWSLLQEVDRQLRNQGFRLLGFDTFCEPDSIYLGVLPEGLADTFLRAGVTDVDIAAPEDL